MSNQKKYMTEEQLVKNIPWGYTYENWYSKDKKRLLFDRHFFLSATFYSERHFPWLRELEFGKNSLQAEDVDKVCLGMEEIESLTHLRIPCNNLGDGAAKRLGDTLKTLPNLQVLDLKSIGMKYNGFKDLFSCIGQLTSLEELRLESNNLGDKGVTVLAKELTNMTCLRTLMLDKNCIGNLGAKKLAISAQKHDNLTTLGLAENNISPELQARLRLATNERYKELLTGKEEHAKKSRLCVVGFPCCGKSSLVDTLDGKESRTSDPPIESSRDEFYRRGKTAGIRVVTTSLSHDYANQPNNTQANENEPQTVVWDFGGHVEYYISHDLILRWCRESVFVVMARLDRDRGQETENIKFWLRFIVSCVHERDIVPSVIIACSHRDLLTEAEQGHAAEWGRNLTHRLGRMFEGKIVIEDKMFQLDTLKQDPSMNDFRAVLNSTCERVRLKQPKMPRVCATITNSFQDWLSGSVQANAKPILSTETFLQDVLYSPLQNTLQTHNIPCDFHTFLKDHWMLIKICLQFLHDCGQIIWLDEEKAISFSGDADLENTHPISSFVVVNPKWFCNTVLGAVLRPAGFGFDAPADIHQHGARVSKKHITDTLLAADKSLTESDVEIMLTMLCTMGLCYDSIKSPCVNSTRRYLFPGAVDTVRPTDAFEQVEDSCAFYIGRHIELKKEFQDTLILSPAVRPLLQERIMELAAGDMSLKLWATGVSGFIGEVEIAMESTDTDGIHTHNLRRLTIIARTVQQGPESQTGCKTLFDKIIEEAKTLCGVPEESLLITAVSPISMGKADILLGTYLEGVPVHEVSKDSKHFFRGCQIIGENLLCGKYVAVKHPTRKSTLTRSQENALSHVRELAKHASAAAKDELFEELLKYCPDIKWEHMVTMLEHIAFKAQLNINAKLCKKIDGKLLIQLLCEDKDPRLKNLFEARHGNGNSNLDVRKQWERNIFGKAYDIGEDKERPKYGNMNLLGCLHGEKYSKYYGDSYFVLKHHMRARVTISSGDSAWCEPRSASPPYSNYNREKVQVGTLENCAHVLLDVLRRRKYYEVKETQVEETQEMFIGRTTALVKILFDMAVTKDVSVLSRMDFDLMPNYLELHIHGEIRLGDDVDKIQVNKGDHTEESKDFFAQISSLVDVAVFDPENPDATLLI
eukprot:m.119890 g.119890  ORF g.119890 m.119890 type:complete len:1150 (+) comp14337_c0_seq3:394-3843(+)